MDLDAIYSSHPLSAASIMARLARQDAPLEDLTQWHLAIDADTEITDQNHEGGVQAVLELASAAAITSRSVVVDVGSGLGGSARVLAAAHRCRILAIERDAARCADSATLTRAVGLDDFVTTLRHDALLGPPKQHSLLKHVDVLWGQSAWVHFADPGLFLDRWIPVLIPGGRVAVADSFLARVPQSDSERTLVHGLETSWAASFTSVEHWEEQLLTRGCRFVHDRDVTQESAVHLRRLLSVSSRWPDGLRTELEVSGWRDAVVALEAGLLKSARFVARRD